MTGHFYSATRDPVRCSDSDLSQSGGQKDLFLGTNRLVTRDVFQPNVARQVMTSCRDYEASAPIPVELPGRWNGNSAWLDAAFSSSFAEKFIKADVAANRTAFRAVDVPAGGRVWSGIASTGFVFEAQRLAEQGQIDEALDLIYEQADEMLLAGEFSALNEILMPLCGASLSVDVLLAILTITLPAKSRLPARSAFYHAVEQQLHERGELREGLLTGLR